MSAALRLGILLVVLGCLYLFLAQPYWFPAGVSSQSALIDHQFKIAFWVLGAMFVAAHLVLAYVLSKKTRSNGKASGGSWRLEVTWTLAITAVFFWLHISGDRLWSSTMISEPAGQIPLEVTGAQFQWYFRYPGPDGVFGRIDAQKFAKADEGNPLGIDPADPAGRDDFVSTVMVLPVGHVVQLHLRAQDVIHSLFIPAMRFKQDTVPGMEIHSHFTPTQTGVYEIACAELCGIGHYRMRATVRVVTEQEFEKWLKAHAKTSGE
ncbi:MAG: cytochrome C oxidase subunit II [Acidobacteriia bacterium]|nr:cytochrome C oxidase subunit II [Terriglobia bacterium]